MEIERLVDLPRLLRKKSFFLFGPRATGKSFLIHKQLADKAVILDLLRSDLFLRLSVAPIELEAIISARLGRRPGPRPIIVIDEIQKVPALLDEVHRLIETKGYTFLLTGSSARKLRRGQSNLLAGRAWTANLFPLSWSELGETFDLERYLRFGGLPSVYLSPDPEEELDAYVHTYLYEEIQAEGLLRKLPPFARFLQVAALESGNLINYARVASDAQVPASTVREHYTLLEDTLLGTLLPPWRHSNKRKAIATAKFYLFDTGVMHTIAGTKQLDRNSNLYGRSFEHWIAMELHCASSYHRTRQKLCFWRTKHGHEVDFILGDEVAVEVKASKKTTVRDCTGLLSLMEEGKISRFYLVSQDTVEAQRKGIQFLHYKTFMDRLWSRRL